MAKELTALEKATAAFNAVKKFGSISKARRFLQGFGIRKTDRESLIKNAGSKVNSGKSSRAHRSNRNK